MKWIKSFKDKISSHPALKGCIALMLIVLLTLTGTTTYLKVQEITNAGNNSVEYTTKGGTWNKVNDTTYTMDKDGDGKPDITLVQNGDTWKYYFTVADADSKYYVYEDSIPDGYEVDGKGSRENPITINNVLQKYSHTTNVDDAGNQTNSEYGNSQSKTDVITIPGATSLKVTITYQTESTSYDWVCLWAGNYPSYTASSNYGSSLCSKLGGSSKTTKEYTVDGDTVTIGFRSDGSACSYYGYYAVVEGIGLSEGAPTIKNKSTTDIPSGLTLSKKVEGTAADMDKNFRFDINLSSDREPLQKYVTGTRAYGDVTFKDGTGTVYLKNNEKVSVNGIPEGVQWNITETNVEDYEATWTVNDEIKEPNGTTEAGKTVNVVCTNKKNATPVPDPTEPPKTGGVTVLKSVVNGNAEDTFDYHMVFWGLDKNAEYSYLKGDQTKTYKTDSTGIADFTFTLKDTEHVDFANVPVGTKYQIIEEANDYEASYEIENGIDVMQRHGENTDTNKTLSTAKETIHENEAAVVHFTNTKYVEPEPEGITATVEKVWNDNEDAKKLRPDNVTVYLLQGYADDENSFDVVGSARLDKTNDWKSVFGGLDKTDASGNEYEYKFQEVSVPGYTSSVKTTTGEDTLAATITNTVNEEIGHLKIAKTVTGDDADTNKEFVFTVKLTKDNTPVTGVYELDSKAGTKTGSVVFDENGVATLSLKDKESAVIKNLPGGAAYQITEAKYTGWTPSDNGQYTGTITKDETASVDVVNTYVSGQMLTVSKEVTGTMGNRAKEFEFKLTLTGDKLPETLAYTKGSEKGTLKVENGIVTFTLKHSESITFNKVSNGLSYEVKEMNGDGYRVIYENPDGKIDHKDINVKVVNEKNFVVPTSVNPVILPILLLPIAGIGIGYMVYKKKKKENK